MNNKSSEEEAEVTTYFQVSIYEDRYEVTARREGSIVILAQPWVGGNPTVVYTNCEHPLILERLEEKCRDVISSWEEMRRLMPSYALPSWKVTDMKMVAGEPSRLVYKHSMEFHHDGSVITYVLLIERGEQKVEEEERTIFATLSLNYKGALISARTQDMKGNPATIIALRDVVILDGSYRLERMMKVLQGEIPKVVPPERVPIDVSIVCYKEEHYHHMDISFRPDHDKALYLLKKLRNDTLLPIEDGCIEHSLRKFRLRHLGRLGIHGEEAIRAKVQEVAEDFSREGLIVKVAFDLITI